MTPAVSRTGETPRQLLTRWGLATALVLAVHGGLAFAIAHWPKPENTVRASPAAVMIELAPVPVAPEVPPQEVAVGVQQELAVESTPSEAKETPVEEKEVPEAVPAKTEPPPDPSPQRVERETETPELPQSDAADAVIEAPASPPSASKADEKRQERKVEPTKKVEPSKKVKHRKKKAERRKRKPRRRSRAQAASAPRPIDAARARTNAARSPGVGASRSLATWRGAVMAHLNRHKRYPRGGGRGTASVAFTIDRSGRVLSARLTRSSGRAALDRAAVALPRRASPLPAPPRSIRRRSIVLTVPVRFSR